MRLLLLQMLSTVRFTWAIGAARLHQISPTFNHHLKRLQVLGLQ